jgi:hypothetical protein
MHFHLPKPLHGWREFAGEVGIIVLGVLIALCAEQLVDNWSWRQKVAVVRRSLVSELGNDRGRWEIDMAQAPCVLREVDRLDRWAVEGARGAAVPSTPTIDNQVAFFWMHSANWNLAMGSQALDHFPIEEQLAFARLYDGIAHRQVEIEKATDLSQRVLSAIPLAIDPQGRHELRIGLGSLRLRLVSLTAEDAYMKRHFEALGVKADRSDVAADFKIATCRR